MAKRWQGVVAGLVGLLMLAGVTGCSGQPLTTREKGTLAGGGLGAVAGIVIGAATGAPAIGAVLGGVLGAGSGFLLGNALQNNDIREAHTEHQLGEQQREIEHQRPEIYRLQQEES
jgi:uncharacterized protein YcfJ